MNNIAQTIISQYSNSPTLIALIDSINENVDPSLNLDDFYNKVWNILTAEGFGLDIWGRILNITRLIDIPAIFPVLVAPGLTALDDDQYRVLLLTKAMNNLTDCSAPNINQALKRLFVGRGNAFTVNLGDMHMQYKFLFALEPYEYAIMRDGNAVPRPAGVGTEVFSINPYFGFSEAISWQPFGQGVFAKY